MKSGPTWHCRLKTSINPGNRHTESFWSPIGPERERGNSGTPSSLKSRLENSRTLGKENKMFFTRELRRVNADWIYKSKEMKTLIRLFKMFVLEKQKTIQQLTSRSLRIETSSDKTKMESNDMSFWTRRISKRDARPKRTCSCRLEMTSSSPGSQPAAQNSKEGQVDKKTSFSFLFSYFPQLFGQAWCKFWRLSFSGGRTKALQKSEWWKQWRDRIQVVFQIVRETIYDVKRIWIL